MKRLEHLDTLRGLAALSVVYYHAAEYSLRTGNVHLQLEEFLFSALVNWTDLGKIAVALFFAISGFVIPFSLLKPQEQPLRHFAISRFFRLYPAYWLSMIAGLLVLFIALDRPFGLPLVIANATMLQQFLGFENVIGLYWTLQIELIFYAICAVLFAIGWLAKPSRAALMVFSFLVVSVAMAALRYYTERKLPVAIPLGLTIMFWGLLWRYARENGGTAANLFYIATVSIVVFLPIIALLAYNADMGFHEKWYRYVSSYVIAIFIFCVFTSRVIINNRFLLYIGTISYSIYLLGPIAQESARWLLGGAITLVPTHVFIVLTLLLSVAMATLSYRYVEAPAIALGRRLRNSRRGQRSALKFAAIGQNHE